MSDESWDDALRLLCQKLRDIGRPDIADFSKYYYVREGKRKLPSKKLLVTKILQALEGEMRAQSPDVVGWSLNEIRRIVGDRNAPTRVVICKDPKYGEENDYELPSKDKKVTEAVTNLGNLIKDLRRYE